MNIATMSVEAIIDHLCERCELVAIVAKYDDGAVLNIAHGDNGLEILGAIALLQQTHGTACHRVYNTNVKKLVF